MITSISRTYCGLRDFLVSAIKDDATKSLLTRPESEAIKGVLILLIVLGHDKYVQIGGMNNVFLYSFHVYAFYYLPFLYDYKNIKLGTLLKKNLLRLYVPYTIVFLLLFAIATLKGSMPTFKNSLLAYICGSQYLLSQNFGFGSFLWFIPTMFSVLLYRWVYYHLGFRLRCFMLVLSGVCLLGYAYMIPIYVATWFYSPFCLTVALGMVLPGVILRGVCRRMNRSVIAILFFMLVVAIMIFYPVKNNYGLTYLTINRLICPILIFSFILCIKTYFSNNGFLIECGKLSFRIYLIHIFIYNAIYSLCDSLTPGIYAGLGLFIICFALTFLISKVPLLRYVFPQ